MRLHVRLFLKLKGTRYANTTPNVGQFEPFFVVVWSARDTWNMIVKYSTRFREGRGIDCMCGLV